MRHREFMVKSEARWVNHMSRKNISSMSQSENGRGEAEYNKWKYTKPDIKVFVNDADWHIKEAQSALDRDVWELIMITFQVQRFKHPTRTIKEIRGLKCPNHEWRRT